MPILTKYIDTVLSTCDGGQKRKKNNVTAPKQ